MRIHVLGAGAWGTALAIAAAPRHSVTLWARSAQQAQAMQAARSNAAYLPDVGFPPALDVRAGQACAADVAQGDLVLIACPVAGLREQLLRLHGLRCPVVWLCKGFEDAQAQAPWGLLPHEVLAQTAPDLLAGVCSGPSFAQEVALGRPTALVAASAHPEVCQSVVDALHGASMRIYASADVAGVEVGGAVKNVLAIATGVLDALARAAEASDQRTGAPGLNARAALLTRGLAEMTRLGVALGADASTFLGLSGMGDLVLTATGQLSRNRRVGELLAQGMDARAAVATLGHVAEGVRCAPTVLARARALGVEMPIAACVVDLLQGRATPQAAAAALMGRSARDETDAL